MNQQGRRHTVFGAGLIGGYLGAALMLGGASVGWVVRDRVREKLQQGLKITDYKDSEQHLSGLEFVDTAAGIEQADVLWLTIKCTALDACIDEIRGLLKPETIIISLQNGLGAENVLQSAFPEHRVIRGIFGANVMELAPGHLHRGTEGGVDLHDSDVTRALGDCFPEEFLPLNLHADIDGLVWAKLHLNLNNAINALSDIPLKAQLSDSGYRRILAAAQRELLQVVERKGIRLAKITAVPPGVFPWILRLPNWLFMRVSGKMLAIDPEARSSMWCDLDEGRRTEIEFLNGAVVRECRAAGVDCPVNTRLTELVGRAEAGELNKGLSAAELLA